jgi:mono/diheme cytochrome c family protein
MQTTMTRVANWGFAGALATAMLCGIAQAEEETIGSDEYRVSCLNCHGVGGRGDGPLAKFLTVKPTDLTTLAKNNGGEYPYLKVFLMIDGREDVAAHGDREMPVWGNRYRKDAEPTFGPFGGEEVVHGRILELVYYIHSIQQQE